MSAGDTVPPEPPELGVGVLAGLEVLLHHAGAELGHPEPAKALRHMSAGLGAEGRGKSARNSILATNACTKGQGCQPLGELGLADS